MVKALLEKGAQIDARTKDNYTPLHVAVENCKYLVVQMLLGYGADVQIRGGKVIFIEYYFKKIYFDEIHWDFSEKKRQ